jgi:muramoyltetrapeptide carboxypeptidase
MLVKQGRLANVSGIIFGGFTSCKPDLKFPSIETMLHSYVRDLGIPVCFGFPAGHVEINLPLIEGAQAELTVGPEGTILEFLL